MKTFQHKTAASVAETLSILSQYNGAAKLMAGGTDLLGVLKTGAMPDYPQVLVNIKPIAGLDEIKEKNEGLSIGALTRLSDIVESPLIQKDYPILADAAASVAMPQIRNAGTLGGNLAQETRCWYFRYPHAIGGRIMCKRKGDGPCLAVKGDNRYHALFGAKKCFAVCPSDMAVALAALDADITIAGPKGGRTVKAAEFYHPLGNALEADEMITQVEVPKPAAGSRQVFIKHRVRDTIDFATVSLAMRLTMDGNEETVADARVILGAVAPGPYQATGTQTALAGKKLDVKTLEAAASAAVEGAVPLKKNGYKIDIIKSLIKNAF